MNQESLEPHTIRQLGLAPYESFAMIAGMQLELFTPLSKTELSLEELAKCLEVKADKLQPLVFALVTAGLLNFNDGFFTNTPEAEHFLVKGKPAYLGGSHTFYTSRYRECFQTAASIRESTPKAKLDFAHMSEADLETYYQGMHPGNVSAGRALAKRFDLSKVKHLLDVGGGSGGLAIGIAEQNESTKLSVLDLPSVTPFAERYIGEARLQQRIKVIDHDIIKESPSGRYDFAVLKSVIQVLSPEEAHLAMKNIYEVLEPGGMLYVAGHILDDSRLSPPEIVAFNIVFLNVYDKGQAYTEAEYRIWLGDAGFVNIERTILTGGTSFMTAFKPEEQQML